MILYRRIVKEAESRKEDNLPVEKEFLDKAVEILIQYPDPSSLDFRFEFMDSGELTLQHKVEPNYDDPFYKP